MFLIIIMVGEDGIPPTASCRNIGVVFDDTLTFETHINSVYKTSFWHLRSIWCITRTKSSLEILIHAFITNKLDYCDSLLTGLPKYLIKRIQPVQNAAARLVSGSKKHARGEVRARRFYLNVHSVTGNAVDTE